MKLHMLTLPRRRSVGFTIVELLVTVAVITILASISFVGFNAAQANTRDSVRAAEVAVLMDALEKYYQKNGDYPANDALNPNTDYPRLTNFSPALALLPGLTVDSLKGPGDYQLYPGCVNGAGCANSSSDWKEYMIKSYLYLSRYSNQGPGAYAYYNVPASYGDNTGWGCTLRTYYTNPGYAIAWYSESKKIWIFKRSQHGQVELAPYTTGPIAPQTCAFS